jgi:hypothetical protein
MAKSAARGSNIPPTIEEVKDFIRENGYPINADRWYNHYLAKGWLIGKTKMKNWHAAVRTWIPDSWFREKKENRHYCEVCKKEADKFRMYGMFKLYLCDDDINLLKTGNKLGFWGGKSLRILESTILDLKAAVAPREKVEVKPEQEVWKMD